MSVVSGQFDLRRGGPRRRGEHKFVRFQREKVLRQERKRQVPEGEPKVARDDGRRLRESRDDRSFARRRRKGGPEEEHDENEKRLKVRQRERNGPKKGEEEENDEDENNKDENLYAYSWSNQFTVVS